MEQRLRIQLLQLGLLETQQNDPLLTQLRLVRYRKPPSPYVTTITTTNFTYIPLTYAPSKQDHWKLQNLNAANTDAKE